MAGGSFQALLASVPAGALVYPTLDPSKKQTGNTLSGGNLTNTGPAGSPYTASVQGTVSRSSGKWYWETLITTVGTSYVGISNVASLNGSADNRAYNDATTYSYGGNGNKLNGGSESAYGATYTNGNIISVAFDADNGRIFFAKNGVWQNSGDPAAGTGAAFTGLSGAKFPLDTVYVSGVHVLNFGASPFAHSVPSGFSAITV